MVFVQKGNPEAKQPSFTKGQRIMDSMIQPQSTRMRLEGGALWS